MKMSAQARKNGDSFLPCIIVEDNGKRTITATLRPKNSFLGFYKKESAILCAKEDIKRNGLNIDRSYIIKHHF